MRQGIIHWMFKGKTMSAERAFIKNQKTKDEITVETKREKQPYVFLLIKNQWLLSNNTSSNSPLCGTRFVASE